MLYELPPWTQLDTSWSHLETPQEQRKRPNLTEKCLKQKVLPGLFQSSQATVLELWASPDLLDAARHLLESIGDAPEAQKSTRLDTKMPQPESRHPGLFQSSQATILELWAPPDLLGPPWMQLDTSWSDVETPQGQKKRPDLTEKCLKQKVTRRALLQHNASRVIRKRENNDLYQYLPVFRIPYHEKSQQ